MKERGRAIAAAVMLAAALLAAGQPAAAQWEFKSEDGKTSLKFGFLLKMRAESEELANGENADNLFVRNARLLFGGKFAEKWSFFVETDSPNLGKSDAAGNKDAGDLFFQDIYLTYEHSAAFKADFGMILVPLSRNSGQSAATHLAQDYGPYSFLHNAPTKSRIGRDYGVQARGYLAGNKLEYRAGVFDGNRGANASEDLRFAGRLAYNVFEPEVGIFYTGSNLGAKRQLAFGAGFDHQDDYTATALDVFFDQPIGGGSQALTFQADWVNYDGGDTFTTLPEQTAVLVEVGYLFGKFQPFVQFADRNFDADALADEDQLWLGLNYRANKHNTVARLAYGKLGKDGADDRDVLQLTLQIFKF
jgi:hypothetical protein